MWRREVTASGTVVVWKGALGGVVSKRYDTEEHAQARAMALRSVPATELVPAGSCAGLIEFVDTCQCFDKHTGPDGLCTFCGGKAI